MAKLADYKPLEKNPNLGSKRGNDLLEKSLENGGVGPSICVANDGEFLAGNHTAQKVGEMFGADVKIIEVQTTGKELVVVRRVDIPNAQDEKAKHLIIGTNRVADVGHNYDLEALQEFEPEILEEYFFTEELAELEETPNIDFHEYDESAADDVKMCTCPNCGHEFAP